MTGVQTCALPIYTRTHILYTGQHPPPPPPLSSILKAAHETSTLSSQEAAVILQQLKARVRLLQNEGPIDSNELQRISDAAERCKLISRPFFILRGNYRRTPPRSCTRAHTRAHTHTHTHTHTHKHSHTHTQTLTHIDTHTHIYIHAGCVIFTTWGLLK